MIGGVTVSPGPGEYHNANLKSKAYLTHNMRSKGSKAGYSIGNAIRI